MNRKPRVIIVHRWDGTPNSDWYPWLKRKLEKDGLEVLILKMPNPSNPKIEEWVPHLRKAIGKPDEHIYLVGHSIGCQTILRYLEEIPKGDRVGGVVLVAGWVTLQHLEDKEAQEIARPWLETPLHFSKMHRKSRRISVVLSSNDPFVNAQENGNLFKENLHARVILLKNKWHFTEEDGVTNVPEVYNEIKSMILVSK